MIFLFILFFGTAFLFMNIRSVAHGTKGSLIAGVFLIGTFLCFLFREQTWAFTGQSFFAVWLCESLLLYISWNLFRLIRRIVTRKPLAANIRQNASRLILAATIVITTIFLIVGNSNNANFQIRQHTVTYAAPAPQTIIPQDSISTKDSIAIDSAIAPEPTPNQNFTAVFFSDLHMDPLFKASKLERLASLLDSIKPDYVLFGGDLADIKTDVLNELGYNKLISKVASTAKIKAIAINGNHEGYMERSGSTPMEWLRENGWLVLEDSTACMENACFTGRVDFQVSRTREEPRAPLSELAPAKVVPQKENLPWILMDHQPKGIETEYAETLRPTIALSGHTHDGQFFPGTVVINWVWRLAYGLGELDGTRWLVTSGIDSWGPPVRIGSETEVWVLDFAAQN